MLTANSGKQKLRILEMKGKEVESINFMCDLIFLKINMFKNFIELK